MFGRIKYILAGKPSCCKYCGEPLEHRNEIHRCDVFFGSVIERKITVICPRRYGNSLKHSKFVWIENESLSK